MYQPSPKLKKLEVEKDKADSSSREQYYKKRERTARAHRLITRGAAGESVLLGKVEFFSLVERIFSMPDVKGVVMEAVNTHNVVEQSGGNWLSLFFIFMQYKSNGVRDSPPSPFCRLSIRGEAI